MDNYDIAIIGAGPAGMTAAIYAARSGKSVAVLERTYAGGQMLTTETVENYPAAGKISGWELSENMKNQAQSLGARFIQSEVTDIRINDEYIDLISSAAELRAKYVIMAMGTERAKLNIAGEDEYTGKGVSKCATCDGAFFKGKSVAVIGGGNTAVEEAAYLSGMCDKVYIVHRRDTFRASASEVVKLEQCDNVVKVMKARPISIDGDGSRVTSLTVDKDGAPYSIEVSGVFVSIGSRPVSDLIKYVDTDKDGYIITDADMRTSQPRIYAAGDVTSKRVRQIVTACSDGAIAAESICRGAY
ncbi:MAG: FAD-dependent oxidoreductase [Clostridia bacterium]|nr:FAD-dependent oxidoreductase [Clostridia bacterium]